MKYDQRSYRSFLLRLWQVEQNNVATWRCSLEETGAGQRRNFASLDELIVHLRTISTLSDQPNVGSAPLSSKATDLPHDLSGKEDIS